MACSGARDLPPLLLNRYMHALEGGFTFSAYSRVYGIHDLSNDAVWKGSSPPETGTPWFLPKVLVRTSKQFECSDEMWICMNPEYDMLFDNQDLNYALMQT
jgi:hypothetical protein